MPTEEQYSLAVQLRGEGIDETASDLEDVEERFDETSESVDDSATEMEGFARKWQGAMNAVLVGLTVAAGGLLSQVPLVGEAMSGLEAILEGVAFQMDSVLRPAFGGLTDGLFGVADAVFEAEGAWGQFIGILGSVIAAAGIATSAIFAIATITGASMAAVAGAIAIGIAVIAAIVGIVALLKEAWDRNLGGIQGTTERVVDVLTSLWNLFGDELMSVVKGAWTVISNVVMGGLDLLFTLFGIAVSILTGDWARAWELAKGFAVRQLGRIRTVLALFGRFFQSLWDGIVDLVSTIGEKAVRWGSSLVDGLKQGISQKWTQFTNWLDRKIDDLVGGVKSALGIGSPSRVMMSIGQDMVAGVEMGVEPIRSILGTGSDLSGVAQQASNRRSHAFADQQEITVPVRLDGREIARATSRFRRGTFEETGRTK